MSQTAGHELEALLARISDLTDKVDEASHPRKTSVAAATEALDNLESKIEEVDAVEVSPPEAAQPVDDDSGFTPEEPTSFEEAGLSRSSVEDLILKFLFSCGEASGQQIADQIRLPFTLVDQLVPGLKNDQLIHYRGTTAMNDHVSQLTDLGRERARRLVAQCTYFGAAPVPLDEYYESIGLQSLQHQNPTEQDVKKAFDDLLINPNMFLRLGAAVNSGRGMFLYGFPGNGKTSIAERVTKCFGEYIWIPRTIVTDGEIIRVFDPSQHEEAPQSDGGGLLQNHKIDKRWVRIRRPTIVVGGELTMDNLELTMNPMTGINEAPVQLKSNCGTLVIDDFGRQQMTTDELLNRWIVPLETRYDFLNLPSGKKIQVPFDQLVVFSTNLEPRDLVDDAFLRRIPYKIEVENPSEAEFIKLFELMCGRFAIEFNERAVGYLLQRHYKPVDRPLRCCHPRDLLLQIQNYCQYTGKPVAMTKEALDFAVDNYFSIM